MSIYDTDVFLSLDLESETQDIKDFKAQFNVVNTYYEKYTKYLKDIPFKSEETSERKSLSMFYHNFKAMEMILEHIKNTNVVYDIVVKFRADILSDDIYYRALKNSESISALTMVGIQYRRAWGKALS